MDCLSRRGLLGGAYQRTWHTATVLIIGCGHIGANAVNVFLRNKFRLIIIDKHPETLRQRLRPYVDLEEWDKANPKIIVFDESAPDQSVTLLRGALPTAEIVLCCAVRRATLPKSQCEFLIRNDDLSLLRRGSVICDATACDHDFIESCVSSPSLSETYERDGVIHYNCDHIPSLVANTATRVLTNATFPYIEILSRGVERALLEHSELANAVMCFRGRLTHAYSGRKKGLVFTDFRSLCAQYDGVD